MFRTLIASVSLLACMSPAIAVPYSTYTMSKDQKIWQIVINATGNGIMQANIEAEITFGRKLFCSPDTLVLTGENYDQIMTEFVHDHTQYGDGEMELALMHALVDAFPCE